MELLSETWGPGEGRASGGKPRILVLNVKFLITSRHSTEV